MSEVEMKKCPACNQVVKILKRGEVKVWEDHWERVWNYCRMSGVMVE